ncbi:ATP-binding protein [Pseudoalteromonas luteoviolacea]|uniref:Novel STAND NTPase 1 domain-containing protein n=1 Tax=Pseudoalteromonas luteoviolacea S4054 TaxID=1129367 RepID=A0A0F6A491_9GAMM|nr:ATP-binding protein [Pseudoalteromonas luteoviolacea]AOT09131.1 hypothetical protein S4054249_15290 [Pseudoalteromonas luteoviolacea]AOT14044.1 hypothetical protein S40542_15260 [Pseudoalteromonas luteoviolacea]AOT18959.1 hypothetical protein S4054_15265 [Pseudoalteromonas luteoviolacea]KKE81027.1 hypothetical protein N479_23890 [Pseudoalteromonas luteoviolacea S4054]KZN70287.1 hypothetical protein N481_02100 [Pseudoalteromonas luteoviolacea S4047-1]
MHILLSDKRYTYSPKFRFIKPKDRQKVKVKFANDLILALGYKFKEQSNYFAMAAEAAFMSLNPLDRQNNQFFIELNLETSNQETVNLQEDSTSVGLGYALSCALAYRAHIQKPIKHTYTCFATGEVSPSGNVHSIGHINNKIQGAIYAMTHRHTGPFVIFYPLANHDEIDDALIKEVALLGGELSPVEHITEALQLLLGDDYDGAQQSGSLTFKGLRSFEPHDAYYFFGRDQLTSDLLTLFNESKSLIKVHGVSGSGKSSLIKAGLLPALIQQENNVHWQIGLPKDFADSNALLKHFICSNKAGFESVLKTMSVGIEQFIEELIKLNTTFLDELALHLTAHKKNYIWYIDQFEEIFEIEPNNQLLQSLALLSEHTSINVIVSIRSEYLHHTDMVGRDFYVPHSLTAEDWLKIINYQAIALGIKLEDGLAQTIQTEALKLSHALPAVEYLLAQMHALAIDSNQPKVLTFSQYNQLNKLTGVVYRQAEYILGQFEPLTEQFFELFIGVNINGTCYSKHVDFLVLEQENPHLLELVNALIEKQLVIRHQVHKHPPYVKLTHDCLITIAEERSLDQQIWPRFYIWLSARKEYLQWFHGVEAKYKQWKIFTSQPEEQDNFMLGKHELQDGTKYLSQPGTISLQSIKNYILASQAFYQSTLEQQNKAQKKRLFTTSILFVCAMSAASFAYYQKQLVQSEQAKTAQALSHLKDNVLLNIDSIEPILAQYLPTFQRKYLNGHISKLVSSVDDIALDDIDKLRLLLIKVRILRQDDSTHIDELQEVLATLERRIQDIDHNNPKEVQIAISFNYEFGVLLIKQGRSEEAQQYLELALKQIDDIPVDATSTLFKAKVVSQIAFMALWAGDVQLAAEKYNETLQLLDSQVPTEKLDQEFNILRINTFRNLAKTVSSEQQASDLLLRAKTALENQLKTDPNHLVFQYNLLRIYINLAENSSNNVEADKYYNHANELVKLYAIKDPDNVHVQVAQLLLASRLGSSKLKQGYLVEAQTHFLEGLDITRKLRVLNDNNIDWQGHSIELYMTYADYFTKTNQTEQSAQYYEKALKAAKRLYNQDINNVDFISLLQGAHSKVAIHLYNQGDKKTAQAHLKEAEAYAKHLTRVHPDNQGYQVSYRKKLFNLGYIASEIGETEDACNYFGAGKALTDTFLQSHTSIQWQKAQNKFEHYIELLKCN